MPKILLELCIASADDADMAQQGGADRLELNSALTLGGLTPTLGTFAEVKQCTALPVIAMIRPRAGGFCYTAREFACMVRDAEALLASGVDGLAFGILTAQGELDVARCRVLRTLCEERVAVFHRAFDVVPKPLVTMEQLIDMGFQRFMTSGQEPNTLMGTELVAELIRHAAGRIEVLPAGGIKQHNVTEVVTRTGCTQIHASLRTLIEDRSVSARPHIRFGSASTTERQFDGTDLQAVHEMVGLLRSSQA